MVQTARTILACSLVLMLTASQFAHVQSTSNSFFEVTRVLKHIDAVLGKLRNKRYCVGPTCGPSHLGESAANRAQKNYINRKIYECVMDPTCSPMTLGRGKRSLNSASSSSQQSSVLLGRLRQQPSSP